MFTKDFNFVVVRNFTKSDDFSFDTDYSLEPLPALRTSFSSNFAPPKKNSLVVAINWAKPQQAVKDTLIECVQAQLITRTVNSLVTKKPPLNNYLTMDFKSGNRFNLAVLVGFKKANNLAASGYFNWVTTAPLTRNSEISYSQSTAIARLLSSDYQLSTIINTDVIAPFAKALSLPRKVVVIWGASDPYNWHVDPNPPPPPPPPLQPFIIPVLGAYYMTNAVLIKTLPDLVPINAVQVSLNADLNSWCWTLNLTIHGAGQLDLLKPANDGTPKEIRVTLNGENFDFICEHVDDSRRFGQHNLTIKGSSHSAYLTAPYVAITDGANTEDINAHQLATSFLTNTGWDISWQLTDWLILNGAFNHRGTPLQKLMFIAESVGASIQTAPSTKQLSFIKHYPVLPWDFASATPTYIVPLDIMTVLPFNRELKPFYNSVYVSGQTVGVSDQVIRTSTAGDINAPMIVHRLITHHDAARMAGEKVLSDVGLQASVPFVMPVDSVAGIIKPGALIEVGDDVPWRGITQSVAVSASWSDSGLVVWQTVTVKRFFI